MYPLLAWVWWFLCFLSCIIVACFANVSPFSCSCYAVILECFFFSFLFLETALGCYLGCIVWLVWLTFNAALMWKVHASHHLLWVYTSSFLWGTFCSNGYWLTGHLTKQFISKWRVRILFIHLSGHQQLFIWTFRKNNNKETLLSFFPLDIQLCCCFFPFLYLIPPYLHFFPNITFFLPLSCISYLKIDHSCPSLFLFYLFFPSHCW